MKIFKPQKDINTFVYPATKIMVALLLIFISITRNYYFCITNTSINVLITVICTSLVIACTLCIYIAVIELFVVWEKRRINRITLSDVKLLSIDSIIEMILENDIIEIEIIVNDNIVKIGSSSNCKYSSNIFTDKLYYCGDSECDTIDLIHGFLYNYFPNQSVPVIRIDGISPV